MAASDVGLLNQRVDKKVVLWIMVLNPPLMSNHITVYVLKIAVKIRGPWTMTFADAAGAVALSAVQ